MVDTGAALALTSINSRRCRSGEELARAGRDFAGAAQSHIRQAVLGELVAAFHELVAATPEDTGRAKAGWRIAITPDELHFLPGEDAESIGTATENAVPMPSRLAEAEMLHVVTNVPYVPALNAGWSTRAPGGFVDAFILSLEDALNATAHTMNQTGRAR